MCGGCGWEYVDGACWSLGLGRDFEMGQNGLHSLGVVVVQVIWFGPTSLAYSDRSKFILQLELSMWATTLIKLQYSSVSKASNHTHPHRIIVEP